MVTEPQLYIAKVMHKRLFPKENSFHYGVYYLALPLPAKPVGSFFARFHPKDVGHRDGSDPSLYARDILTEYGLNDTIKQMTLVTMPRILGYVFNPVSFYFCKDALGELRAVICEVHNTFGEQHSYLCAHSDHAAMTADQWFEADKVFHVSPFLHRSGTYKFRFDLKSDKLGIWIDFYDDKNKKQLVTSLMGTLTPLTRQNLSWAFWRHPMVTIKAIMLIHWQAVKLLMKGIRYIPKPDQRGEKVTATRFLRPK